MQSFFALALYDSQLVLLTFSPIPCGIIEETQEINWSMERKNKDLWSFGRDDDDSDKSSEDETPFSTRSSSSSSESSSDSSDEMAQSSEMENIPIQEGSYDVSNDFPH